MAKLDLKLESLISKYERISDAMETGAATKRALNYLGEQAIASVKKATPVRSGTLRREWKLHNYTGRNYIVVANNTDYALYVEKGHRVVCGGRTSGFVPPTYMLRNTLIKVRKYYLPRAQKMVLEDLSKID